VNKKTVIIKLGGSVITDKKVRCSARIELIQRICEELSKLELTKILIHGAGSFGHHIVKQHEINLGYKNEKQLGPFTETCIKLRVLNNLILKELTEHNVPAAPFHPSSFIAADKGRIIEGDITPINGMLRLGLTPLLHGDIVYDRSMGFSIVSGDQLAAYLARIFKPDIVIFGCDVDGVYSYDPKSKRNVKLLKKITPSMYQSMTSVFKQPDRFDVTGGMKGKVEEAIKLAEIGIESVVINLLKPENLTKLINGTLINCTRITPDS